MVEVAELETLIWSVNVLEQVLARVRVLVDEVGHVSFVVRNGSPQGRPRRGVSADVVRSSNRH